MTASRSVIRNGHHEVSSETVIHEVVITRRVSSTKWSSQRVVSSFGESKRLSASSTRQLPILKNQLPIAPG